MTLPKIEKTLWGGKECHCQEMTLGITIPQRPVCNHQVICLSITKKLVVWHGAFSDGTLRPDRTEYSSEEQMVKGIAMWIKDVMDACKA